MFDISSDFTLSKFYLYAKDVERSGDVYRGGCPVCHEGKSWGKKKRMHFIEKDSMIYCHNCNGAWSYYDFLHDVCGMSAIDIRTEIKEIEGEDPKFFSRMDTQPKSERISEPLPLNSINLCDPQQVMFYEHVPIVKKALRIIKTRRLATAKYAPKAYYISLDDPVHKNRLVVPFYHENGEDIIYYQSRRLIEDDSAKYLSKISPDKKVFNLDKIDVNFPYVFCIEGPIDASFLKNGVGICGIILTNHQKRLIRNAHPFCQLVYIMDNPNEDKSPEVKAKYRMMSKDTDNKVFVWGSEFDGHKDFNSYAQKNQLDEIPVDLIVNKIRSGPRILLD